MQIVSLPKARQLVDLTRGWLKAANEDSSLWMRASMVSVVSLDVPCGEEDLAAKEIPGQHRACKDQ
jgi:hypothetical protein